MGAIGRGFRPLLSEWLMGSPGAESTLLLPVQGRDRRVHRNMHASKMPFHPFIPQKQCVVWQHAGEHPPPSMVPPGLFSSRLIPLHRDPPAKPRLRSPCQWVQPRSPRSMHVGRGVTRGSYAGFGARHGRSRLAFGRRKKQASECDDMCNKHASEIQFPRQAAAGMCAGRDARRWGPPGGPECPHAVRPGKGNTVQEARHACNPTG